VSLSPLFFSIKSKSDNTSKERFTGVGKGSNHHMMGNLILRQNQFSKRKLVCRKLKALDTIRTAVKEFAIVVY
jgi:hypothetical protein